ncbi:MAG: 2-hydroxyacid dehydrogenase [Devosia sp.]|uniref:2-hydroxyacid dehydrogenase n=1 Tax=Devosia sp. 66-22 TaxID=1895753 RepID=UPI0009292B04|nr:2-hydroxyacid dehydrogenase [Devosia sp. 66-22]MBN9346548.1 2-hydroxyacid dehydrogenase [Devosia sp.]OJX48533.1 MAG: 2-hydroxyacid dehydrogenase [Devosia sp. 66-22]
MSRIDIVLPERIFAGTRATLEAEFAPHFLAEAADRARLIAEIAPRVRAIARGNHVPIDKPLIDAFPNLEIIAVFGAGYDGVDVGYARERGLVVTNTPDVLNEEVADYTIGLLVMTARDLLRAERYLRDGSWARLGQFAPTPGSLRDRTVGLVGFGRIGRAIARRLDAMRIPVVYHARHARPDAAYRYYGSLLEMAADVDTLIVAVPGGAATRHLVDAEVLAALGRRGIVVNIGRGSAIDEDALIKALETHSIQAAGLDVFSTEPAIDPRFLTLDNAVLLPHSGSASQVTHGAMGQLLVDNLKSWFGEGRPLTPVPETPWPPARRLQS